MSNYTIQEFPRIDSDRPRKIVATPCIRCGGTGVFSQFHGTCWRCSGRKVDPKFLEWGYPRDWSDEQCRKALDERLDKNVQAKSRREEKAQAAADLWLHRNLAACPTLAPVVAFFDLEQTGESKKSQWPQAIRYLREGERQVLASIAAQGKRKALTEKQQQLVVSLTSRSIERSKAAAEEEAKLETPPSARKEVVGKIISFKVHDTQFGSVTKILVACETYKLYGTLPSSCGEASRFDVIKFTATITPKECGFGFFSRPAKGELLAG
jgi:hypothetical protein